MPETLVNIPPLQMPSDISSEAENLSTATESTDRSSRDTRNACRLLGSVRNRGNSMDFQSKHKLCKLVGKRYQKKIFLRPLTSQQKTTNSVCIKSQIPRAVLLTPSSSSTSLITNDSLASTAGPFAKSQVVERALEVDSAKLINTNLGCQKTGIIVAFHQRKSFSQMDFNHARRQNNFSIPSPPVQNKDIRLNGKALMPTSFVEGLPMTLSRNTFVHKTYNQEYYYGMQGRDPQMAGMRIFATIMLNAWRKRRDEVKKLMEEVSDLKRAAIKTKNQLHVFNSLFRVEQKRNEELNCQLKKFLEDINITKSSCESLTTSLISLKADKALLEQQIQIKEQEFETLNALLTQTKSDLFKSMTVQRELQASLSMEQRKIQTLENQKNELINEICELNNEAMLRENELRKEVEIKTNEINKFKNELKQTEEKIKIANKSKEKQLSESKILEERMRQEIEKLENELRTVHKCLDESIGSRFKNCWHNYLAYQRITLQMLHLLAYYVLPATPAPKINSLPFGLSLEKALNIVKR